MIEGSYSFPFSIDVYMYIHFHFAQFPIIQKETGSTRLAIFFSHLNATVQENKKVFKWAVENWSFRQVFQVSSCIPCSFNVGKLCTCLIAGILLTLSRDDRSEFDSMELIEYAIQQTRPCPISVMLRKS